MSLFLSILFILNNPKSIDLSHIKSKRGKKKMEARLRAIFETRLAEIEKQRVESEKKMKEEMESEKKMREEMKEEMEKQRVESRSRE